MKKVLVIVSITLVSLIGTAYARIEFHGGFENVGLGGGITFDFDNNLYSTVRGSYMHGISLGTYCSLGASLGFQFPTLSTGRLSLIGRIGGGVVVVSEGRESCFESVQFYPALETSQEVLLRCFDGVSIGIWGGMLDFVLFQVGLVIRFE